MRLWKFLLHLQDRSKEEYKSHLYEYFQESSQLTKTINFIIANDYLPVSKAFCQRSRFRIDKSSGDVIVNGDNGIRVDQTGSSSQQPSQPDENDYYLTLESNIFTTNKPKHVNTVAFPHIMMIWIVSRIVTLVYFPMT